MVKDNKNDVIDLENSNNRRNLISWYPFNQNSSILEICEKKSVVTEELCSKCKNVTTIEFSKIKKIDEIKEKYDYILLNYALEYSFLYSSSLNCYEEFLNILKKLLKKYGKILIAIDNKLSINNSCEYIYSKIEQSENKKVKKFTKLELESLVDKCNLNANFYYVFPNCKYPQIIYTDDSLNRKVYVNYLPFYVDEPVLLFNETSVYRRVYNNNLIPYFSNSFFIELSSEKKNVEIDFVKFNSFRKDEYRLYTYSKNKKYYKKELSNKAEEFLKEYSTSSKNLEKCGFNAIEIKKDKDGYYTDEVLSSSFLDIILEDYKKRGEECLLDYLKEYEEYLKSRYNKYIKKSSNNAFKKYGVKIDKNKSKNLHFLEKAYIDIIPQNMLLIKKDYYLIDQEWTMENVPYEYILYRGIISVFQNIDKGYELENKYLEAFNILDYSHEFRNLEDCFQASTLGETYYTYRNITKYKKINDLISEMKNEISIKNQEITLKNQEINDKNEIINNLEKRVAELDQELCIIINSKSWKMTKPIRSLKQKLKKINNNYKK